MSKKKRKCEKVDEEKYKTRDSPPYHANDCPNEIKEGNDENLYVSKKDKNGVYKWVKIHEKKTAIEYYKQFPNYIEPKHDISFFIRAIPELKKELNKIGVNFYYIEWEKYGDSIFTYEYFKEDVLDKLPPDTNYMYVSEMSIFAHSTQKDGKIYLQYRIDADKKEEFNRILKSIFPNRTRGYENITDAIKIELVPKKNIKAEKEKIMASVIIIFEDDKNEIRGDDVVAKYNKGLKNIAYVDEYDMVVSYGEFLVSYRVTKGKEKEFEAVLRRKDIPGMPAIKEIKIDYY